MTASVPRPTRLVRRAWALTALTAALALAAGVALAAPDASFEAAFADFSAASGGDTGMTDKALDEYTELLKAEPANPVLMAYVGAATALKSKSTVLPWKKMGYAEDGLAQIDKALSSLTPAHDAPIQHQTPGSLEVRFIAANTFLAVPDFMNRGARGTKLLNDVIASPLFARAPAGFRGQVLMRAANLAVKEKRVADARHYLSDVVAMGAPQTPAARAMLKGLPE